MKRNITLVVYALLTCTIALGQKQVEVSPYAGFSTGIGDYVKNGFAIGLSGDYFFSPQFGLGFDINQQKNDFTNPADYSRLTNAIPESPFTITSNQSEKWSNLSLSLGPVYRIDMNLVQIDIFAKSGISIVKNPMANDEIEEIEYQDKADLFSMSSTESTLAFGITSGIRVAYKLNEQFKMFLTSQYVYSAAKVQYQTRQVEPAFYSESEGETFSPTLAIFDTEMEDKTTGISHLNINLGITYSLPTSFKMNRASRKNKEEEKYIDKSSIIFMRVDETLLRQTNTQMANNTTKEADRARVGERKVADRSVVEDRARVGDRKVADRSVVEDRASVGDRKIADRSVVADRARVGDRKVADRSVVKDRARVGDRKVTNRSVVEDRARVGDRYLDQNQSDDVRVQTDAALNKKAEPTSDLDTRIVSIKNKQSSHISSGKYRLTAPVVANDAKTDDIEFTWTVNNVTAKSKEKLSGETIDFVFQKGAVYAISITSTKDNKKLDSNKVKVICD